MSYSQDDWIEGSWVDRFLLLQLLVHDSCNMTTIMLL